MTPEQANEIVTLRERVSALRGAAMSDDADKKAAELLPCACLSITKHHSLHCPAYYRPAVATALWEKDNEIEKLKAENLELSHTPNRLAEVEAERDYFQAELEAARLK